MDRKTDKYPQVPHEPSVERLSSSLVLRRVEKRKEKVKDGERRRRRKSKSKADGLHKGQKH